MLPMLNVVVFLAFIQGSHLEKKLPGDSRTWGRFEWTLINLRTNLNPPQINL